MEQEKSIFDNNIDKIVVVNQPPASTIEDKIKDMTKMRNSINDTTSAFGLTDDENVNIHIHKTTTNLSENKIVNFIKENPGKTIAIGAGILGLISGGISMFKKSSNKQLTNEKKVNITNSRMNDINSKKDQVRLLKEYFIDKRNEVEDIFKTKFSQVANADEDGIFNHVINNMCFEFYRDGGDNIAEILVFNKNPIETVSTIIYDSIEMLIEGDDYNFVEKEDVISSIKDAIELVFAKGKKYNGKKEDVVIDVKPQNIKNNVIEDYMLSDDEDPRLSDENTIEHMIKNSEEILKDMKK